MWSLRVSFARDWLTAIVLSKLSLYWRTSGGPWPKGFKLTWGVGRRLVFSYFYLYPKAGGKAWNLLGWSEKGRQGTREAVTCWKQGQQAKGRLWAHENVQGRNGRKCQIRGQEPECWAGREACSLNNTTWTLSWCEALSKRLLSPGEFQTSRKGKFNSPGIFLQEALASRLADKALVLATLPFIVTSWWSSIAAHAAPG